MSHFLENNLLKQSQHGFMPRKPFRTNLLEFFRSSNKCNGQGKPFDVVFLDFAKVFD
jgi:hypothetical protein